MNLQKRIDLLENLSHFYPIFLLHTNKIYSFATKSCLSFIVPESKAFIYFEYR